MRCYSAYVERAKALAHEAHAGQVDKAGEPYINHVARVAAAVSNDPLAECVAWLHDAEEDNPEFWESVKHSLPEKITYGVFFLTRIATEHERDYYGQIKSRPICLRVKLADIADNCDPARLAKLDPKTAARLRRKYAKALRMLGAA